MIKRCKDLTIHLFSEISLDISNVKMLLDKDEKATEDELVNAWYGILDEYHGLLGNRQYSSRLKIQAELQSLRIKLSNYMILHDMSLTEKDRDVIELAESVCKFYKTKFDTKRLLSNIRAIRIKLKIKESNVPKSDGAETEFIDAKALVEKYLGFHLDKNKIYVDEFVAYTNQYKNANKPKQTQKRKTRNG